jgi:ankyrin repeat protein
LEQVHYAAGAGSLSCCEVLLTAGFPVDTPDAAGQTPIHHAALCHSGLKYILLKRMMSMEKNKKTI